MEARTGCRDAQSQAGDTVLGGDGGYRLCSVPGKCGCVGTGARESRRAAQSAGSASSMQGAGGDTNLWPRSPGCVRGKLLARDTGREKRNRESKEGCDSPGVVQDKDGTDGHIPSRRQGVTAWERPAAPRTSTEPLSALQGRDVAWGALHPSPCSSGLLPSLASPTEHMEPNKPGLDSHQPSVLPTPVVGSPGPSPWGW